MNNALNLLSRGGIKLCIPLAVVVLLPFAFAGEGKLMHPGTDGVSRPRVTRTVSPTYPSDAAGAAGTVTAAVMVLADGSVGEVAIVGSTVTGAGFEDAVIEAVERWRYKPAKRRGKGVDSYAFVRLSFEAPDSRHPAGSYLAAPTHWMTPSSLSLDLDRRFDFELDRRPPSTQPWHASTAGNRQAINSSWQRHQAGRSVNPKPNQPDARRSTSRAN